MPNIVSFLTDFGLNDAYVGVMKGAALSAAPMVRLVDICHNLPKFDIHRAAIMLKYAYRSFPPGTVHTVVVDPGVGGDRRAIAVESGEYIFVGPDNGVLWPAASDSGTPKVYLLPESGTESSTFHGRDIFAPVAASLACGSLDLKSLVHIHTWTRLELSEPESVSPGVFRGTVQYVDDFGNIVTDFSRDRFEPVLSSGNFRLEVASRKVEKLFDCYEEGSAHELFCLWGSGGFLEISLNARSAAQFIGGDISSWSRPLLFID